MESENREQIIIRTSITGVIANVFLAGVKVAIGFSVNSIAIILDAVNNLSDALSSIITIIGTKLSTKPPDKKHPFGYGRIEYLSAMIVSGIVLYAGITSAVESIKNILRPEAAEYSVVSLVIIGIAVAVKLILGRYVTAQGKKVNSGALIASGSDALFDAVLSSSVLASAILYLITGISLEAYIGLIISAVIIKAGIELMIETLDAMLGKREDPIVTNSVKRLLAEEPEVRGAYDLILYNYGPNKNYGSVHLELPDTMTVKEVDALTRKLESKVFSETGIVLTGVGVYSYNTSNDEAAALQNDIQNRVLSHDWAVQFHGFYLDEEAKTIRFDVVVSFDIDPEEAVQTLYREMEKAYPDFTFQIMYDINISATE